MLTMLHYFCAQQTIRSNACHHQYHITAQARKNKSYQVPHIQLTGKSQQKPAGGHMDLRIRNTHSLEHRRCQNRNLASRINHKVNLNSLGPPCQEPRSRRDNGPDHNRLSTVPQYGCLVGYPCRLFGQADHSPDLWAPRCFASAG